MHEALHSNNLLSKAPEFTEKELARSYGSKYNTQASAHFVFSVYEFTS